MVRVTFEIVIVIWNAHVTAMSVWGQPQFLAQLLDQLRSSQAPPEFVNAYDELTRRRHEQFANDARAVGTWTVAVKRGKLRLHCDAHAAPVGAGSAT